MEFNSGFKGLNDATFTPNFVNIRRVFPSFCKNDARMTWRLHKLHLFRVLRKEKNTKTRVSFAIHLCLTHYLRDVTNVLDIEEEQ